MHKIDTAERRRRIATRHRLLPEGRAATVAEAADSIVAIHGTDPGSVYLAAFARVRELAPADMERALYDERSVLKILGMRRTMFVVPRELATLINSAVTDTIAARERKRTLDLIATAETVDGDVGNWMDAVEAETLMALEKLGQATASELTKVVPGLRVQIPFGAGKKWAGTVGVSTRMLFLLSAEGLIIRGRPKGTWVSSLYNWAPMNTWLGEDMKRLPKPHAQADLVGRWLKTFGPGTEKDVAWWTGWTLGETRKALAAAGSVEVGLDGGVGYVGPGDIEATKDAGPWVALLPALDSTTMGWNQRDWFLGPHAKRLFDTNGNAGPTIWTHGRIVGGWAQRRSGEVVTNPLEDLGRETTQAIDEEAARIEQWLGQTRIVPRFRTPLEQELVK